MNQRLLDIISTVVFLVAILVMTWQSHVATFLPAGSGLAYDPVFYPRVVLAVAALLATVILVQAVFRLQPMAQLQQIRWGVLGGLVLATTGYAALLAPLGFMPATGVFLVAGPLVLGARRWVPLILIAVLFPIISWYLFVEAMGIPLPVGYLFEAG